MHEGMVKIITQWENFMIVCFHGRTVLVMVAAVASTLVEVVDVAVAVVESA